MSTTNVTSNSRTAIISFNSHEQELDLLNKAMRLEDGKIVDETSWDIFYHQYYRFVFTIANKLMHNEDEAEDITQEVFIKCVEKFEQYDQTKPFKPWLSSITKNHCINEMKRKFAKPTHYVGSISADDCFTQEEDAIYFNAIDTTMQSPVEQAIFSEDRAIIDTLLGQMKPEFRAVIELKHFDGLTYEQMAKKLETPIGTIMSRLFNARKKMKELYLELVGEKPTHLN
jgi:RNA polymerase sigma-70 factor (ECF subfamily)